LRQPDSNFNAHCYCYSYGNSNADGNGNCHSDAQRAAGDSNADGDRWAQNNTDAEAASDARPTAVI
jgi:hypothetical protein